MFLLWQAYHPSCKACWRELEGFERGDVVKSMSIDVYTPESNVAQALTDLQKKYNDVEIGSYPFNKDNQFGTTLVMRSSNEKRLHQCDEELKGLMKEYDTNY